MEELLNSIGGATGNMEIFQKGAEIGQQSTVALAVSVIAGLLICLFGLKLIRVMTAIAGLFAGAGLGVVIAEAAQVTGSTSLIIVLISAVIVAALSFFLYRVGVFFVIFISAMGTTAALLHPAALASLEMILTVVIPLVLAILAVVYIEPMIIIVTSISGGITVGTSGTDLLGLSGNVWIGYGIGIVLAVIGMIVQFMMQSRKVGKKEKIFSEKFKQKASMESEVEKARMVLDEEKEEPEEDSKEE